MSQLTEIFLCLRRLLTSYFRHTTSNAYSCTREAHVKRISELCFCFGLSAPREAHVRRVAATLWAFVVSLCRLCFWVVCVGFLAVLVAFCFCTCAHCGYPKKKVGPHLLTRQEGRQSWVLDLHQERTPTFVSYPIFSLLFPLIKKQRTKGRNTHSRT